jgi:oxygen-independent coproporphyrinogen-3 oxidase
MKPSIAVLSASLPPHALMCRFETDSPACTSYPAANRFVEAIGGDDVVRALRLRASRSSFGGVASLAIRVHIPFREGPGDSNLCRQGTIRRQLRVSRYLRALKDEVDQVAHESGSGRTVSRIHIGGAVPLFLSDDELARVTTLLRESFRVADNAVISIEAAASLCTSGRVASLCAAGFNRLFIAIDDLHSVVADSASLKVALRTAGATGSATVTVEISCAASSKGAVDLSRAITQVIALRPKHIRITLFHARPHRPGAVRGRALPLTTRGVERTSCRRKVFERLLSAGYVHIGLDEFALPEDALAIASRQGRLHLGARGFSTRPESDILALGVSAIGRIGAVAYQNLDRLTDYEAALQDGRLPVARGLVMARGDLARECVIKGLLCQGRVPFESISLSHLMDMRTSFSREFALLDPLIQAGLVDVDNEALELTPIGTWFAPVVAAVFDHELQRDALRRRLSRGDVP